MATSNSWDYSVNAGQICAAAGENLGIIQEGGTLTAGQSTTLMQRLNFIAKQFQGKADMAQGLKVHTRQRVVMFLAKGQQTYTVGPAATDSRATTLYGRTTLTAAKAAGQTVLAITANSDTTTYPGTTVGMTNADNVGVVQTDGSLQWTTIAANGSTSVTLNAALTVGAANGAYLYWYTSQAQHFPVLEYAELRNSDLIDLPMRIYTQVSDYERLTNKTAQGDPLSVLCEPLRLNTRITTDFQPLDVTKQLRLTALYPAEDYDATTDDIAFPQEWFAALEWELTKRTCVAFGKSWTNEMNLNYTSALQIARELNPENSSAYFQPGREEYGYDGRS